MATNEILRFAQTDTTTNLLTQAEYDADAQRLIGNQPGVARSKLVNKALRQSSLISAGVAQFIAEYQSNNVTDGLTPANISDYLESAIQAMPVAAGSAAAPSIAPTGDTNTGLYFPAADQVAISTGGVQRVVVSELNIGIGYESVSLPPNTSYRGLFINDGPCLLNYLGNGFLGYNTYTTGAGQLKYIKNYGATAYTFDQAGIHKWYTAPAGTAGSTIPFGDAKMTLNTSGDFLLGITSGIGVGARANIYSSGGDALHVQSGLSAANNIASYNASGTASFIVSNNGNVANTNNSYGAISDLKLKENITNATPKLNDLMRVRVVNYCLKTQPNHKQIGVIAQELEKIFPGMVDEACDKDEGGNDLETTTKSVKYSVFVPILLKAIQEQQALIEKQQSLIESLTARIAALEAK
jgi:hypothetical protein